MKAAVIGSGAWGTALALVLLENGHEVTLWSYLPEESRAMEQSGENPMLKGVPLPRTLSFTTDMGCVAECGLVVLATPSFAVRNTARQLAGHLKDGTVLVLVSKGIEKDTSLLLSQVVEEEVGPRCPVVVLSGPSHAEEVGRHVPTAVVAASADQKSAELVNRFAGACNSCCRSLCSVHRRAAADSDKAVAALFFICGNDGLYHVYGGVGGGFVKITVGDVCLIQNGCDPSCYAKLCEVGVGYDHGLYTA